jgi:hypothetical protein
MREQPAGVGVHRLVSRLVEMLRLSVLCRAFDVIDDEYLQRRPI